MYKCEIIADSLSPQGNRLTTFLVTYPRIVHAEMLRHRMFSRNVASSRAIPFEKMVKDVQEKPFIPIAWQRDHKGMQGTEYLDESMSAVALMEWLYAREKAVKQAKSLNREGFVTKQLCNRLLEPFMWTTELITTSEEGLMNFFELRCPKYWLGNPLSGTFKSKKDAIADLDSIGFAPLNKPFDTWTEIDWLKANASQAEIHIQQIAEMMWDAYNESEPKQLEAGEWHIPFGDKIESEELAKSLGFKTSDYDWYNKEMWSKIKIAIARCARLSYTTLGDNPKVDYEADGKLHDRLLESHHMSPFEHCARAMDEEEFHSYRKGKHEIELMDNTENQYWMIEDESGEIGWCNNFRGFIQYRFLIENK